MHPVEQSMKRAIEQYQLITPNDKLLVAVSGGKDSTVLLHMLHKLGYTFEAITVDAKIGCYTQKNLENIRTFTSKLGVKLHEISFQKEFGYSLCYIKAILSSKGLDYTSCSVCGVLRRYLLNKYAKKLNATKIATGHNLDDESQALFMNIMRGNLQLAARMGPSSGLIKNKKFVQRIKPMFFVREKDIVDYSKQQNFPVHYGKCPCSVDSYRYSVREQFALIERWNPKFRENMVSQLLMWLPKLQEKYTAEMVPIRACEFCGEAATGTICRACMLLQEFNEAQELGLVQERFPQKVELASGIIVSNPTC